MATKTINKWMMPVAYSEFLHYIKKFDKKYIDKIPKNLLDFFEKKCDKNYVCDFDYNKPLSELELKYETRLLINIICYQFWCENDEQKNILRQKWMDNEKIEQEKIEQERIQNKKNVQEKIEQQKIEEKNVVEEKAEQENMEQIKELMVYNSYNWYQKIIYNVKNIINKLFRKSL